MKFLKRILLVLFWLIKTNPCFKVRLNNIHWTLFIYFFLQQNTFIRNGKTIKEKSIGITKMQCQIVDRILRVEEEFNFSFQKQKML